MICCGPSIMTGSQVLKGMDRESASQDIDNFRVSVIRVLVSWLFEAPNLLPGPSHACNFLIFFCYFLAISYNP